MQVEWTYQEDMMLVNIVKSHGPSWDHLTAYFPNRNPREIRYRYEQICTMMVQNHSHAGHVNTLEPNILHQGPPKLASMKIAPPDCSNGGFVDQLSMNTTNYWTTDEDKLLFDAVIKHGQRWPHIATMIPGKDEASVRHRWNYSLVKRVYKDKEGVTRFRPEPIQPTQWGSPMYGMPPGQCYFHGGM